MTNGGIISLSTVASIILEKQYSKVCSNAWPLIIRMGFWGVPYYNYGILYYPPKPYSNY